MRGFGMRAGGVLCLLFAALLIALTVAEVATGVEQDTVAVPPAPVVSQHSVQLWKGEGFADVDYSVTTADGHGWGLIYNEQATYRPAGAFKVVATPHLYGATFPDGSTRKEWSFAAPPPVVKVVVRTQVRSCIKKPRKARVCRVWWVR